MIQLSELLFDMVQTVTGFFAQRFDRTVVNDAAQSLLGLEGVVLGDIDVRQQDEGLGHPILMGSKTVGDAEHLVLRLVSPVAASKADKPEETVVFYEDPTEFFDGIFVVFGDGSVKFLEGDFDDHAEALEAAANTFGLSDKAAADLIKKGAAIDKYFE